MNEKAYELIRLCQAPNGWAHYWRKNPAGIPMSAWHRSGIPAGIPAQWMESDLYFSVNAASGDNPRGAGHRVKVVYVQKVQVIFNDVDDLDSATMPLQPSIVVNSGRGEHRYWLLESPIDSTMAAGLQRAWVYRCNADHAAVDLARLLRVPGSVNTKYGLNGARARVIAWEPDRRYTAAQLWKEIGDTPSLPVRAIESFGTLKQPKQRGDAPGIVSQILRSRQSEEFARLYSGKHNYQSASEADAALLRLVAWWVRGDTARMLAIWQSSGLWRDDRCNDDYVTRTLQHGLSGNRNAKNVTQRANNHCV